MLGPGSSAGPCRRSGTSPRSPSRATPSLASSARENWLRFIDTEDAPAPDTRTAPSICRWSAWSACCRGRRSCRSRGAPLVERRGARPLSRGAAASWLATGLVFFSLAAAKRSVYLLPLFPALALLVGAGVANPPVDGRMGRLARLGARALVPATLLLAAAAAAYAAGIDPAVVVRRWLKPDDAEGAAAVAAAAHDAALPLGLLALGTAVGGVLCARAVRASDWRRIVIVVAALVVGWTAIFDARIHPIIGRSRSLGAFMTHVDAIVPRDRPLYAIFPPDPGLRFYAPRSVQSWQTARPNEAAYLFLWEDELGRATPTVEPLAMSDARQAGRGRLALVLAPPDTSERVVDPGEHLEALVPAADVDEGRGSAGARCRGSRGRSPSGDRRPGSSSRP